MSKPVHVLGISGSLRRGSYNTAALLAACETLPDGMTMELYDLSAVPLYNQDVDAAGAPEPVQHLKARIAAADALLIATPEYNHSIPGVLKNAIDWASRPPNRSPLNGKPVAIMGATGGVWGTTRAQVHLRQICFAVNMLLLNRPEVLIAQAGQKFDSDGRLTDETTRQFIRSTLEALAAWTIQLRGS